MINCFVFKPPAPYCLMYQDRSNCSQSFTENQTSLQIISSIVLWNRCQTEELCIVWFQFSGFLAKCLASAIVIYETNPDTSHTYSFVSYGNDFSFCLLVFKIHLSSWSIISHLIFFCQLATKLITPGLSSDRGINEQSPLTWQSIPGFSHCKCCQCIQFLV